MYSMTRRNASRSLYREYRRVSTHFRPLDRLDYILPIRRSHQVLFAEAFAQSLLADLPVIEAASLSARINPSGRFWLALDRAIQLCREGYPLAVALSKTPAKVSSGFVAALTIGESSGSLAEELTAFARQHDPNPSCRLARALGRLPGVTAFAACLARLLASHRLSVSIVRDAGSIAAGTDRALGPIIERMADSMRDGAPFAEALSAEPRTFDPLFCRFVAVANGREQLRQNLAILTGGLPTSLPVS